MQKLLGVVDCQGKHDSQLRQVSWSYRFGVYGDIVTTKAEGNVMHIIAPQLYYSCIVLLIWQ